MGWNHFNPVSFTLANSFFRIPAAISPRSLEALEFALRLFARLASWHTKRENELRDSKMPQQEDSAWCIIDFDNRIFQARVVHIGRGKYLILKDNQNNEFIDIVVDASNILACDPKN